MCRNGSEDYSDGLKGYSNPKENAASLHKSSCGGTEISQLYCDSNAIPPVESPPTESPHATPTSATSSSRLIISHSCIQNWLGHSMEPLSVWDATIIRLILLRTALRYSALGIMAVFFLFISGTWILRGSAETPHFESLRQNVPSEAWPCVLFK